MIGQCGRPETEKNTVAVTVAVAGVTTKSQWIRHKLGLEVDVSPLSA